MIAGLHFDDFLTPENFYLAFQRLQTASRNLYKELYYEDIKIFGFHLESNIATLLNEIKQEIYNPESSYKIFIPKKNNLFRPLSLLKFKDLLIYQAIINTIGDVVYDEIAPHYNDIIFANIYNTSKESKEDRIFFFKPWKEQWNKFQEKTKKYYEQGYKSLADFDIASFFDTIDHRILQQILENNFKVDSRLVKLLIDLLEAFTSDSNHKTWRSKHGIPQGPIGSPFLADLYLFHAIDLKMSGEIGNQLDIQYIRYVDDIRIFSKDKISAQKAIAYLDLLARDLGLIPQPTKIVFNEVDNIDEILKSQKNKFSLINKEYKKSKGTLKSKTHRNLKKRFIECFKQSSDKEQYLDKTVIRFSLYKLNKDEDVKNTLLDNWEFLYIHFEDVLYYLRKHFYDDEQVLKWLIEILCNRNILFHHIIALIFKYFPDIEFIEDVYRRYFKPSDRHWLVTYFMLNWLYNNNKFELALYAFKSNNYFLNRKFNNLKYMFSKEPISLKILTQSLLEDRDSLVALQGLNLGLYYIVESDISDCNDYINSIFSGELTDYIKFTLEKYFSITSPEKFFHRKIWIDEKIYNELNMSFRFFWESRKADASKALLNLNNFNNLVYDKICEVLNIQKKSPDYGVNLNAKYIEDDFPITNRYFAEINDKRNQKSDAHPYDKSKNVRIRVSIPELETLVTKQKKALEEICKFDFISYF